MTDDLAALMSEVLSLSGVLAAALVDEGGAVRADAAEPGLGFRDAGPLVASALAASRVLGGFVGGELRQTVIEYRGGPVVLAPVPHREGSSADDVGMVLALRLETLEDLGRARFHLPRLLAQIAAAT